MRGKRKIPTDISIYGSRKNRDSAKWTQTHDGNLVLWVNKGRTTDFATEVQSLNPELPSSLHVER